MKKPRNWDDVVAKRRNEIIEPPAGAYICKVVSVLEMTSRKSGRPMLVIDVDIADGRYKNYFKTRMEEAIDRQVVISWGATIYQLCDEKSASYLKGLIDMFEASNKGFKFDWDNSKCLAGKKIGVLFDYQEYENQKRQIRRRLKVRDVYTTMEVDMRKVPEPEIIGVDGKRRPIGEEPAPSEQTSEPAKKDELEPVDDVDIPF